MSTRACTCAAVPSSSCSRRRGFRPFRSAGSGAGTAITCGARRRFRARSRLSGPGAVRALARRPPRHHRAERTEHGTPKGNAPPGARIPERRRPLMTVSIREIIGDEELVALTYRQALEPVEGRDAVVHPPTYASREEKRVKGGRRSEHVLNERGDGTRTCALDTVQSQANRMEASYRGELAGVIPRHVVEAGGHRADLTELPHLPSRTRRSGRPRLPAPSRGVSRRSRGAMRRRWRGLLRPLSCTGRGIRGGRAFRYHGPSVRASRHTTSSSARTRRSTRGCSVRTSSGSTTGNGRRGRRRASRRRPRPAGRAGSGCGARLCSRPR